MLWWLLDDPRLSAEAREASLTHRPAYRDLPYVEVNGSPLRDPFDRLLVAQAQVESIPIVTRDPGILAYGPVTIW